MAGRRPGGGGLLQTFRALLVTLVCLSAGLTAVYGGASLSVVAGATAAGLVLGLVVVTVALPTPDPVDTETDPRLRWEE
jgi:hypothetical protein